jgi:hypothetical protein
MTAIFGNQIRNGRSFSYINRRFLRASVLKMAVNGSHDKGQEDFRVIVDEKLYSRYLTLYNRKVQYPDGQVHEFDVCGHAKTQFKFAVVMPFNTKTQKVTVVSEFSQGCGKIMHCFPSGGLDVGKHDNMEAYVSLQIEHGMCCCTSPFILGRSRESPDHWTSEMQNSTSGC